MEIADRDLVLADLPGDRRTEALREMVTRVGARFHWKRVRIEECLWEVLRRHAAMPSGLGAGLAFPSARLPDVERPVLAVASSKRGLDFEAKDRRPAHTILLYLGRVDPPTEEREFLSRLAGALGNERVCRELAAASSADELWDALRAVDAEFYAAGTLGP